MLCSQCECLRPTAVKAASNQTRRDKFETGVPLAAVAICSCCNLKFNLEFYGLVLVRPGKKVFNRRFIFRLHEKVLKKNGSMKKAS